MDSLPDRILMKVCQMLIGVASVTFMLILGLAILNIVGRRFSILPHVRGFVEYSEVGLVVLTFLSLPLTQLRNQNVSVDILMRRLPETIAFRLRTAALVVSASGLAWAGYVLALSAVDSYSRGEMRMSIAQVPAWPGRSAVAIGVSLTAIIVLRQAVSLMRREDFVESDKHLGL